MKKLATLTAMIGVVLAVAACAQTPAPVQVSGLIDADPGLETIFEQAEEGDPDAQRRLADRFLRGIDDISFANPQEAAYWYGQAAENGDLESQRRLGELYREGAGVERDLAEAFRWYETAARRGDSESQYWTGIALTEWSDAVTPDPIAAYTWFELAARSYDSIAGQAAEARDRLADDLGAQDLTWARLMVRDFEPAQS